MLTVERGETVGKNVYVKGYGMPFYVEKTPMVIGTLVSSEVVVYHWTGVEVEDTQLYLKVVAASNEQQ